MDEEFDEEDISFLEEMDAEAAFILEIAALILDDNVEAAWERILCVHYHDVPGIIHMAAMIIAMSADHIASYEKSSAEQVLMEFRLPTEMLKGDSDGRD